MSHIFRQRLSKLYMNMNILVQSQSSAQGTGSLTQVVPHSNKFLRNVLSWNILISKCSANLHRDLQIPKHLNCKKVNNTSLPMFTTHRDYTRSLWYQTNNIHTECKTPVKCLKYHHHTNYFNFSQHNYFVFDFNFYATQHFKQYSTPYSHQRSWIEASKLCRSAGGTLPIIRSREELDELMSLLKYGSALPPIEILYLGFITNAKVSKIELDLRPIPRGRAKDFFKHHFLQSQ